VSAATQSELFGTAGLWVALLLSLALTLLRRPRWADSHSRERVQAALVLGLAAQCLHFLEELLTHFPQRFPTLLGLAAWSDAFFAAFNLIWLSIWLVCVLGLALRWRLALLPIWFFALSCLLNGVGHPLLSLARGGYFPGLITSPLVGVIGVLLGWRLLDFTRSSRSAPGAASPTPRPGPAASEGSPVNDRTSAF
jgi:hypothetical protein